jgi:hypothetical protein
MVHIYNCSYSGGVGRRIRVQGQSWQKHKTLSENKTKAKNTKGVEMWLKWWSACLAGTKP